MTIAAQTFSLTMSAANEGTTLAGPRLLVGLTFRGTGLTAAQGFIVRDSATPGSGSVLADYVIEAATDNADLWGGRQPQWITAISLDNTTVAGTWLLTAFFQHKPPTVRVQGA